MFYLISLKEISNLDGEHFDFLRWRMLDLITVNLSFTVIRQCDWRVNLKYASVHKMPL